MGINEDLINIVELFSSNYSIISVKEDCDEFIGDFNCSVERIPDQCHYDAIISFLSHRDDIYISVLQDGEVVESYNSKGDRHFGVFIGALITGGISVGSKIEIKYTILKKKEDGVISIYFIEGFINYLEELSLHSFLFVINNRLNDTIIFEIQGGQDCLFFTRTISFVGNNSMRPTLGIGDINRGERLNLARANCYWDEKTKLSFLPEDLVPCCLVNSNDRLSKLFQNACLVYSCMFLFDYSSLVEEKFSYKLNGYRTLGEVVNVLSMKNISLNYKSFNAFYKVYEWCYLGGNISDKINIARNIISLNFTPSNLCLSETTIDAIQSNFKIYERENVKQYIQVRNRLSELLVDLQTKISAIVDGFIGDFKKNITTLISFFISVIVIRVVSKGDFIGGFTNEILILSLAFLLVSVGFLFYSRWEFSGKVDLFEKHYDQLKDRYKDLLSEDELENIFKKCNPQGTKNNESFVLKQKKMYTILWAISIVILFIAIIIIFFMNNKKFCDCLFNYLNDIKNVV